MAQLNFNNSLLPSGTGPGGTPAGAQPWFGGDANGYNFFGGNSSTPQINQNLGLSPWIMSNSSGTKTPAPTTSPTAAPPNLGMTPNAAAMNAPPINTPRNQLTPAAGGFNVDPSQVPAGYYQQDLSHVIAGSGTQVMPTFTEYLNQRQQAMNAVSPESIQNELRTAQGGQPFNPAGWDNMTLAGQFAQDYARTHPDAPEIQAAGGVDAFVAKYNVPGQGPMYTPANQLLNGQVPGQTPSSGGAGMSTTAPSGTAGGMGMPGSIPGSNGGYTPSTSPATPAPQAGSPGGAMITDPSKINGLAQLIFSPGAAGAAGSPYPFPNPSTIAPGGGTPDQALAYNAGDIGYLESLVASGGMPTSSMPAWFSSIMAQQRNTDRQAADLAEKFGVSGNRFSTAFGTAMTDFYNQSNLNQNAMLAQLTQQSLESAANRTASGAGTLAQLGQSGLQQLSAQNYGSQQQSQAQQLQAALAMLQNSGSMTQLMAQLGAQGAMGLQQGAIQGAQGLFGAENSAASQNAQLQMLLQQMGLGASNNLSQLWQSNLGLGSQLGGQQYSIGQSQLNNLYQEFLRTQPQSNPLLPYMAQGAGQYPSLFYPNYQPSNLGSILGGTGSILGSLPGLIDLLSKIPGLFNNSGGSAGGNGLLDFLNSGGGSGGSAGGFGVNF